MARHCFGLDLTPAEAMDFDEGEITMTGQQMDVDLGEESEGEYDEDEEDEEEADETSDHDECDDVTGEEVENEFSF